MKSLIAILSITFVFANIEARPIVPMSHAEMTKSANCVVILETVKTEKSTIPYSGDLHSYRPEDFQAWVTTLKVLTVFKGDVETGKSIKVLHYSYADNMLSPSNGALFITFPTTPVQRKIVISSQQKKTIGTSEHFSYVPIWLSYLQLREDGLFEPISSQYDSALSFEELAPR